MTRVHSRLIWVILIGLVVFVAYLYWNPSAQDNQRRGGNFPVAATTSIVKTSPMVKSVSSLGTAIANQSIKIIAPTNDFITELNIEEGKAIAKGAVIAHLHDVQERARVTELEAILSDQKRQLGRLKNLASTQATAQSLIDEQQTRVNTSIAQLDIAKAQLAEMTIVAPFSGYLGLRQVSQGAYLNSGTVITTLDDLETLKVEFSVAEHYLAELKLGWHLKLKILPMVTLLLPVM